MNITFDSMNLVELKMQQTEDKINKINQDLDKKEAKIMTIESFIDRFIPIRIQSQISESLGSCLPRRYLNKFDVFEYEKFKKLNDDVLKNSDIQIMEKM